MKKYAIAKLVFDFDLYPRGSVDAHHVGEIAAAIQAGATIPPLVIEKNSLRIVDGFHRGRAYRSLFGDSHEVDCIEKSYADEAAMFLDAMRYNASHGRALTQHDKVHCLLLGEKFKLSPEAIAEALHVTVARIGELRTERIGSLGTAPIALKQTIRHMGGKSLTAEQAKANEKLSGMNQLFYVHQLVILIENDLIDSDNDDVIAGLLKLRGLLDKFAKRNAA